MAHINFWNGNKSSTRRGYETELLEACLKASQSFRSHHLEIDDTDYLLAEEEGAVFEKGTDILVTVAGNVKFKNKPKIVIPQPLAKGLLGFRLLVVRDDSLDHFGQLEDKRALQALSIGIPETWADAGLFRENRFEVVEKGAFGDLFALLKREAFDYTALGANEIEAIYTDHVEPMGGMSIEPSLMIYYPFPLVFAVHPGKPELARGVEAGLESLMKTGDFENIFNKHHGDIVARLGLKERRVFTLENPILPESMRDFNPTLLD